MWFVVQPWHSKQCAPVTKPIIYVWDSRVNLEENYYTNDWYSQQTISDGDRRNVRERRWTEDWYNQLLSRGQKAEGKGYKLGTDTTTYIVLIIWHLGKHIN